MRYNSETKKSAEQDLLIQQTKQLDLRQVVAALAPLPAHGSAQERVNAREVARPCPKCDGEDRFHVTQATWFCRQCAPPKSRDAIDFVRWLNGGIKACSMEQALDILAPYLGEAAVAVVGPAVDAFSSERSLCRSGATVTIPTYNLDKIAREAELEIATSYGIRGREYLFSRGILPVSWKCFHLGYNPKALVPKAGVAPPSEFEGLRRGAITIPWFVDNRVTAILHRFVEDQIRPKKALHSGSKTANCAYWCTHVDRVPAERTLYLVEGELNAISIFQEGYDAVSLGSQSATMFTSLIERMRPFKRVVIWYDLQLRACRLGLQLSRANLKTRPVSSVMLNGDANALLQTGHLSGILARL